MVAGVSAAMNELRPCAPIRLKHLLAQELVKGLQAVSDSLLRYNTTRMLRENESQLFLSLCRAFIEVKIPTLPLIFTPNFFSCIEQPPPRLCSHFQVAYPHCAMCFGRCYTGGASLVTDAKNLFDGIGRLLANSCSREVPRQGNSLERKVSENGNLPVVEDGEVAKVEEPERNGVDDKEQSDNNPQTEEKNGEA